MVNTFTSTSETLATERIDFADCWMRGQFPDAIFATTTIFNEALMTNRFRWLPFMFAIFVGGCGGESEKLQRQEAERVAKEATEEAKKSTAKQHREEALSTIETLRKKHNATLSWRTPFNPTRKPKRDDDKTNYREESLFSRPLHSFEIQQILETTDETPFLFVGRLIDVIGDGTRCKCYFAVELRGNYVAVELESTELQAREIIRVSDAVSLDDLARMVPPDAYLDEDEDQYHESFKRFAIVVREISVAKTGRDRVIHGKLCHWAPRTSHRKALQNQPF